MGSLPTWRLRRLELLIDSTERKPVQETTEGDGFQEITEMCRCCGEDTTEWTAVTVLRESTHLDEIEVTDADPLTVLCRRCCTEQVTADMRSAVAAAISTVRAA